MVGTAGTLVVLVGAGGIAGLAGGLLGIGGGVVMVPTLVAVGLDPLQAVATSLVAVAGLSARAFLAHRRHGRGSWRAVVAMGPGGLLGAAVGSSLALLLGGVVVLRAFALLELWIGGRLLLRTRREAGPATAMAGGTWWRWSFVGLATGGMSAFFGIGGGIVAVPLQLLLGVGIHEAIANSSGLIVVAATGGILRYLWRDPGLVDLGAAVALLAGALVASPLGVRIAHRLSAARLRRCFGGLLILVAAVLLVRSF